MDRKIFFDGIRQGPFPGALKQGQVDGTSAILDEWERRGLTDLRWLAYMLATAYHETAHTMQPIAEFGHGKGHPYGQPDPVTGKIYYGRGYVQLTWKANYQTMSELLDVNLVDDPEQALNPDIAAAIMFEGMTLGSFTKRKLSDFFTPTVTDWVNARKIINGLDRADLIAGYGTQFYADLQAATAGS